MVDWPLLEWSEDEGRWTPLHHPFTPFEGDLEGAEPGEIVARAYDVVWNGVEIGGGSIRISDAAEQERVLGLLGIDGKRRRPASASCWRRCASGPRRTAASPTASIGSARSRPARNQFET